MNSITGARSSDFPHEGEQGVRPSRRSTECYEVIVVSPTPRGGNLEHAADLALTFEELGRRAAILSREGARHYLAGGSTTMVDIHELVPRLPSKRGALRYLLPLIQEHLRIRRFVRRFLTPGGLVILEDPRYPVARILTGGGRDRARVVGIVHNAREHTDATGTTDRIRNLIAQRFVRSADLLVTHGERQATQLRAITSRPVLDLPLPLTTRLLPTGAPAIPSQVLCLGAIRRNKGIEIAIDASRLAQATIDIVGEAIDPFYLDELRAQVRADPRVKLHEGFIESEEFEARLRGAAVVVLPYTRFDAQSGVLARAMRIGAHVVSSDLPALQEQAHGYHNIRFFPSGEVALLAQELVASLNAGLTRTNGGGTGEADTSDWGRYASAITSRTA